LATITGCILTYESLSENVLKVSPRFSNLFEHKLYINDYEVILYKFVFCVD